MASNAGGGAAVLVVIIAAAYFIPLIIAALRHVPNVGSVAVVNIFLGWTFIGWVAALAMACRSAGHSTIVNVNPYQGYGPPVAAPPGAMPAGWYPVPEGQRWFDGQHWTEHLR